LYDFWGKIHRYIERVAARAATARTTKASRCYCIIRVESPDEPGVAIEHLDFAIAELRHMKMQPALERALRH